MRKNVAKTLSKKKKTNLQIFSFQNRIYIYSFFILVFLHRMSKHDQLYFPSDVRKFNWDEYCYNYNLGLLRYIGNDTLTDFEPARKRMKKFYVAHFCVLVIYYSLLGLFYFYLGRLLGINNLISSQIDRIKPFSIDLFNWHTI